VKADRPVLLLLIPGFAANEDDTACLPLQQSLVQRMQLLHPAIEIIVYSFQYPFSAADYKWNGVTVKSFAGKNRGGIARRILWFRVTRAMAKLNRERKILGILSCWIGECAYIGKKFAVKNKLKHFTWVLGQDAKGNNPYVNKMDAKDTDLLALSNFISREMQRNYGITPAHIVLPGIDPADFSNEHPTRDIDILAAGSLITLKQFHIIIEVAALLKKQRHQLKVVICGEGPERPALEQHIKNLSLEKEIELPGVLPHPSLLALMQRTKLFLHPSAYEGFGMVCPEALYAGAKVISFQKPVDVDIPNWYIVDNTVQMTDKAITLLKLDQPAEPIVFRHIDETAKEMLALFTR
jgi:glycosyltransferase involved in cell wall biosynthesis